MDINLPKFYIMVFGYDYEFNVISTLINEYDYYELMLKNTIMNLMQKLLEIYYYKYYYKLKNEDYNIIITY